MSKFKVSEYEPRVTKTGLQTGWECEVRHEGLGDIRQLSASETYLLDAKVKKQADAWEVKYERLKEKEKQQDLASKAGKMTADAIAELKACETLLHHTLTINDAIEWEKEKRSDDFSLPRPKLPPRVAKPPKPEQEAFTKKISIIKVLFGQKKKEKLRQSESYQAAVADWKQQCATIDEGNTIIETKYASALEKWNGLLERHNASVLAFNDKIDVLKAGYEEKDPEAVVEYCELVLENSSYPDSFPTNFELDYNSENGMLIVDFALPSMDDIPLIEQVRYIKTRDELSEKKLSEAARKRLYESVVYQISLRTIHELYEADTVGSLETITFNGYVTSVDVATGHPSTACIMSLQSGKEEFEKINLSAVDPKACFKALKGVGSAKISSITPVKPILELDKTDRRFRNHHDVADCLDESTNLASMDWEEFEHLVREVFEKEFAAGGGEVKVTQASSDGGIDAVAFDPDPIRGGKIVIQAKRYTNVVGVAAVRDLYGTMMAEGATKGILVTTSDYGPDSYKFALGKPLTLLSGANLLHLLEKHGHAAKIDIEEAKRLQRENAS